MPRKKKKLVMLEPSDFLTITFEEYKELKQACQEALKGTETVTFREKPMALEGAKRLVLAAQYFYGPLS